MELTKLKKTGSRLAKRVCLFAGVCLWSMCCVMPVHAQSQNKILTGTVLDAKGELIAGASILEKGTTNATMTDVDGRFTITVRQGATLTIAFLGYKTQTYVVGTAGDVRIVLQEDSKVLDEVVVVGYGMQKKENLTGAVASVDVEKTLASRPIADIGRGLQGAVAGLSVRIPSGEVGSDPIIRLRGQFASIEGSKAPLILLDNVEIPSIQMVNPDDVESISFLKDAASSSIYGSKGAFGVVLITTKKGSKTEKISVTYSGNFSWQNVAKDIEMAGVDGLDYVLTAAERIASNPTVGTFWKVNRTSYNRAVEWQEKYGGTVKATDPVVYNRDWYMEGSNMMGVRLYDPYEVMVREWAPTMTHNFSLTGKSHNTTYNIGLGYMHQNGMMKPAKADDFTRYNASVSLSSDVNKYLTIRGGAMYSDRNKRYPASAATNSDPWYYLYRWSPMFPVGVEEHGVPVKGPVYETANAITSNRQYLYYSVNFGATLHFSKDWDLQVDYTHYNQQENRNYYLPNFTALDSWANTAVPTLWKDENGNQVYVDDAGNVTADGGVPAYRFSKITYNPPGGTGAVQSQIYSLRQMTQNNTFNAYSTYNLKLGGEQEHVFKFTLGTNIVTNKWSQISAEKTDLLNYDNPQFNFAVGDQAVTGNANWDAQAGFFGRVNYAFKDKYLVEANLRYDGSSKFPGDLQWKWYPSFSGGWIFTNESFIENLEIGDILSFGKIRASWGALGDQSVANNLYVSTLAYGQSQWLTNQGRYFQTYGTPSAVSANMSWQTIETLNLGVDVRFWDNRVGVTFDWYQTYTRDMIIPGDALPSTYGAEAPKGNYGNARTRGWDLTVDFNHRFGNGIGISAMATLADADTFITKGADYMTPWENRSIGSTYATGARYNDVWGYVTDRLYQKEDFVYDAGGNIQQVIIIYNGVPKTTNMLVGNNPNYQSYLESGNFKFGPGDVKYVDLNGDGYITSGEGTFGDPGDRKVIGNQSPHYEYGFRLGADYKGFDVSVFFQGVGKREIVGDGSLAVPGYNTGDGSMAQAIAGDFWKEDRTDAYYPRPWNVGAGAGASSTIYNTLVQTRYLLDMSYLRIKNITIGYSLPENILRKIYLTKARVYLSLENFFTFDHLRGLPIDPEEISGYSMWNTSNYNFNRTGQGTPTFKSISAGVQISF
jgi:TonB-linked SusC/RagA family outer membrane protein